MEHDIYFCCSGNTTLTEASEQAIEIEGGYYRMLAALEWGSATNWWT